MTFICFYSWVNTEHRWITISGLSGNTEDRRSATLENKLCWFSRRLWKEYRLINYDLWKKLVINLFHKFKVLDGWDAEIIKNNKILKKRTYQALLERSSIKSACFSKGRFLVCSDSTDTGGLWTFGSHFLCKVWLSSSFDMMVQMCATFSHI